MKKFNLCILLALLLAPTMAVTASPPRAVLNPYPIAVDGALFQDIDAVNIDGNTYIQLRELSRLTASELNIVFENDMIIITTPENQSVKAQELEDLADLLSLIKYNKNTTSDILKKGQKSEKEISTLDDINFYIKKGSVRDYGLTVVYESNGRMQYTYGEDIRIDTFIDGVWYQMPTLEVSGAWTHVGHILSAGIATEVDVYWDNIYGRLPEGVYRLIKGVSAMPGGASPVTYNLAVEFVIR